MSVGSVERLTGTCPNCGRSGNLPLGVTAYPKTVKCKGCQTRFSPAAEDFEEMILGVLSTEEPDISDFEQPVLQPVERTPVEQRPMVSRDDRLRIPAVEGSTWVTRIDLFADRVREFNTRLSEKMEQFNISPATVLLLGAPLIIGTTIMVMWLLSVGILAFSSEAQARAFLVSELDKWVADQPSAAKPFNSAINDVPVNYEIKNLCESPPLTKGEFRLDQFSDEKGEKLVATYRANVDLEFLSRAQTSSHKVVKYRLVKYSPSGQWRMAEGDSMIMGPR